MPSFPKIAAFRSAADLRAHLDSIGATLPCDDAPTAAPAAALSQPAPLGSMRGADAMSSNRFVIHPMEGWDGTDDGLPTELTERRWRAFGRSGAGIIWGGEAAAICPEGRANPNQLMILDSTAPALGGLRAMAMAEAREVGVTPIVGLQLTHSGRWARVGTPPGRQTLEGQAKGMPAPRVAFRHGALDERVGVKTDDAVLRDEEIDDLVSKFARAAHLAREEGFDFVDIKHCHGYLLHEFLAARGRQGRWGGATLTERTALLRQLVEAVRQAAPGLGLGVRLSAFDTVPHRPDGRDESGHLGPGVPVDVSLPYDLGFGIDREAPTRIDLREPIELVRLLLSLDVKMINVTAGSPYYCPHIQRPAAFPPSDGYAPPEDPLVGVARLLKAARAIKAAVPEAFVVSTGWTYLQDYLPHVAEACVREGWFDAVGLGRMVLSYPDLPADVLAGRPLKRRKICRTFSDCTTAPRKGLVSGCYPLDDHYRDRPEREELERLKRAPV